MPLKLCFFPDLKNSPLHMTIYMCIVRASIFPHNIMVWYIVIIYIFFFRRKYSRVRDYVTILYRTNLEERNV